MEVDDETFRSVLFDIPPSEGHFVRGHYFNVFGVHSPIVGMAVVKAIGAIGPTLHICVH